MIKSPCTGICTLTENGKFCIGCGRSTEEITDWGYLSDQKKKKIIKKIQDRSILKKSTMSKN